jgi:signal transduction histidine kinase
VSVGNGVLGSARRWALDAFLAASLLALIMVKPLSARAADSRPIWQWALLATAVAAPLAWRRRAPLAVWLVTGAVTLAALAGHGSPGLLALGPLVGLYTVATISPRRVSLGAGALTVVGVTIGVAVGRADRLSWSAFLFPFAVVAASWLIGDNLRVRRAYVAELEHKAARADADRAAEAARVVNEERARIARELHDVVVHHVSVIAVQAGAARMLAADGDHHVDGPASWAAVEATARQALTELRQLLGVLRHDGERPALAPQAGLAQLDRLVTELRTTGLPVELHVRGTPVPIGAAADLSAYRIVQEALTNVIKHQGSVPTAVSVAYGPDRLELDVASQAAARPAPNQAAAGPGHGLVGMRERVALLGGELTAGPRSNGGFRVHACIPLPRGSP